MARFWIATALLLVVFLLLFLLFEYFAIPLPLDPAVAMDSRSLSAAFAGILLLTADVVLPVPSSLVMTLNGAIFGILLGTWLSLTGSLLGAWVGFAVGRRGGALLARLMSSAEQARVNRLLARWGIVAIILTRPIPLLAETTVIMAGTTNMGWRAFTLAAVAGALPMALIYAIIGATAAVFDSFAFTAGLLIFVAGIFWLLQRSQVLDGPKPLPKS
jgi:3-dehydroquinate synthase